MEITHDSRRTENEVDGQDRENNLKDGNDEGPIDGVPLRHYLCVWNPFDLPNKRRAAVLDLTADLGNQGLDCFKTRINFVKLLRERAQPRIVMHHMLLKLTGEGDLLDNRAMRRKDRHNNQGARKQRRDTPAHMRDVGQERHPLIYSATMRTHRIQWAEKKHAFQNTRPRQYIASPQTHPMMTEVCLPLRKNKLKVRLHVPANPEDECPILQEPIASAVLEAFPRPYLWDRPTQTAMTLECAHTFHAMALVYNWARNRNVLCPVCRAGPSGQRLIIGRLPKEWRYSMATRVRREQRQDRVDSEQHDLQTAIQMQTGVNMYRGMWDGRVWTGLNLNIRIEAEPGVTPSTWVLNTHLVPLSYTVVFLVPPEQLQAIPYPHDTLVRLVPFTCMHSLRPSSWLRASANPAVDAGFTIHGNEFGFNHIHFTMSEETFAVLLTDVYMVGSGESFQLLMLQEE